MLSRRVSFLVCQCYVAGRATVHRDALQPVSFWQRVQIPTACGSPLSRVEALEPVQKKNISADKVGGSAAYEVFLRSWLDESEDKVFTSFQYVPGEKRLV